MPRASLLVFLVAMGCSSKDKKEPQTPNGRDAGLALPAACQQQRSHVLAIYAADPAIVGLESDELRADLIAANVDMAMRDCATSTDKVASCLAGARDVVTIESVCILPLDDSGEVEHRAFGRP